MPKQVGCYLNQSGLLFSCIVKHEGDVRRWGTSRSRQRRDGSEAYPGM